MKCKCGKPGTILHLTYHNEPIYICKSCWLGMMKKKAIDLNVEIIKTLESIKE